MQFYDTLDASFVIGLHIHLAFATGCTICRARSMIAMALARAAFDC